MPNSGHRVKIALLGALFVALLSHSTPAAAQPTLDLIKKVKTQTDKIPAIKTQTDKISSIKTDLVNLPSELPGKVQEELGISMSGELRDKILMVVEDARSTFEEQKADLESFDSERFRRQLGNIVVRGTNTANLTMGAGANAIIDLDPTRAKKIVDVLPPPLLLVVKKALDNASISPGKLNRLLRDAEADLELVLSVVDDTDVPRIGARASRVQRSCKEIADDQQAFNRAATGQFLTGIGLKGAGGALHDSGFIILAKPAFGAQFLGIHGYSHLEVEPPRANNRVASLLSHTGEAMVALSNFAKNRIRHCTLMAAVCEGQKPLEDTCKANGY